MILRSRVLVAQASMCADREDYGWALRFLREAERMVFPAVLPDIQSYVLSSLGRVNWARISAARRFRLLPRSGTCAGPAIGLRWSARSTTWHCSPGR